MKKRVVGYTRVSTQLQAEEGLSLEAQRANLEDYCQKNGYQFLGIYTDAGLSGRNVNRPQLQQLIKDGKKKLYDSVLVWKISRISRNLKDLLTIVEDLEKHDIALISCTEPFDTSTHLGKAFLQILGTFAELERNTLAENVKMSLMDNAKNGKWNGGIVYGYTTNEGELQIDQEEAKVVKEIFSLYLQGLGYQKIMKYLNNKNIPTKKGARWNLQQVRRTLTNSIYIGEKSYNKIIDKDSNPRENPNKDSIIISTDSHPSIIDRKDFDLVQRKIEENDPRRKKRKNIHLLSGIIKCPFCGVGMVTKSASGRKVNGITKYTVYYQCRTYHNSGGCKSFLLNEEKIDNAVLDYLNKIFTDEEILKLTLDEVNTNIKAMNRPLKSELEDIEKNLQQANDELMNLIKFISKTPMLDHSLMEQEVQKKQTIIMDLQKEKDQLLHRVNLSEINEIDVEITMNYIYTINDILNNTDRKKLRDLISTIVSEVIVDENKNIVDIKVWLSDVTDIDNRVIGLPLTHGR